MEYRDLLEEEMSDATAEMVPQINQRCTQFYMEQYDEFEKLVFLVYREIVYQCDFAMKVLTSLYV